MIQLSRSRIILAFSGVMLMLLLVSCAGSKKAKKDMLYLQGTLDTLPNLNIALQDITIQKGDILSIIVYSDNPEATAMFNQSMMKSGGGEGTGGYLVDQQGNIYFQTLGQLHVEGLTRLQLTNQLNNKLIPYLKNPYSDVRFLNFKVTVIGEVNKPGSYSIPVEKLSILELMGLAGDLTIYGKRNNILVIREKDGKREFGRLDIRDANVFQSPYFYLQQNDVVLVEASPKKPTVNDQAMLRNLTLVASLTSIISTVAIIVNVFK